MPSSFAHAHPNSISAICNLQSQIYMSDCNNGFFLGFLVFFQILAFVFSSLVIWDIDAVHNIFGKSKHIPNKICALKQFKCKLTSVNVELFWYHESACQQIVQSCSLRLVAFILANSDRYWWLSDCLNCFDVFPKCLSWLENLDKLLFRSFWKIL